MLLFIIYVALTSGGLILFKLGSSDLAFGIKNSGFFMNISLVSILGLACYLVSFFLWMFILSKNEVSYILPLGVAVTNIVILVASHYVLGEAISRNAIIGICLIILGVIVMKL